MCADSREPCARTRATCRSARYSNASISRSSTLSPCSATPTRSSVSKSELVPLSSAHTFPSRLVRTQAPRVLELTPALAATGSKSSTCCAKSRRVTRNSSSSCWRVSGRRIRSLTAPRRSRRPNGRGAPRASTTRSRPSSVCCASPCVRGREDHPDLLSRFEQQATLILIRAGPSTSCSTSSRTISSSTGSSSSTSCWLLPGRPNGVPTPTRTRRRR